MLVIVKNQSIVIPERSVAFNDRHFPRVRKTITLTADTVAKLQQLERQHNSSMSAIIRAGIELLSKGNTNGKI